jgi:hypothetical protein
MEGSANKMLLHKKAHKMQQLLATSMLDKGCAQILAGRNWICRFLVHVWNASKQHQRLLYMLTKPFGTTSMCVAFAIALAASAMPVMKRLRIRLGRFLPLRLFRVSSEFLSEDTEAPDICSVADQGAKDTGEGKAKSAEVCPPASAWTAIPSLLVHGEPAEDTSSSEGATDIHEAVHHTILASLESRGCWPELHSIHSEVEQEEKDSIRSRSLSPHGEQEVSQLPKASKQETIIISQSERMDTDHDVTLQTSPAQISEKRISISGTPWDKIIPEITRHRSNSWPMTSLGIQHSHTECVPGSDKVQAGEQVLRADSKFARYIGGGQIHSEKIGRDLVSEKNPSTDVVTVDAFQPFHADTDNHLDSGCDLANAVRALECGDVVLLGGSVPFEYRACYAVITKVAEAHCTVIVLDEQQQVAVGECWPAFCDACLESDRLRLGKAVIVNGMGGTKTKHLNGLTGTIVAHPREGHPSFIRKGSSLEKAWLTVCVRFDDPHIAKHRSALIEPRFLLPRDVSLDRDSQS